MLKFTKKYQVWCKEGGEWSFTEYDTVKDAVLATKYSDNWYITQSVEFDIVPTQQSNNTIHCRDLLNP